MVRAAAGEVSYIVAVEGRRRNWFRHVGFPLLLQYPCCW
jgi:hypothetical protein